jgi:hypothetical protein
MSLTLDLSPEFEEMLRQHSAKAGQDVNDFVVAAVREKIRRSLSFGEICAPFAHAVEAAGITDEDFDRFFEEVRDDVWHGKQNQAQ